jgi:3-deoxy-7-phosphoheptulonate synthase
LVYRPAIGGLFCAFELVNRYLKLTEKTANRRFFIATQQYIQEITMTTSLLETPHIDNFAMPQYTPAELDAMHPLLPGTAEQVADHQRQVCDILAGRDPRLLIMLGPCSMDDSIVGGRYANEIVAEQIRELQQEPEAADNTLLLMRDPDDKPRSDLGMRGLAQLDVVTAHDITTRIANMGVPYAAEVMRPEGVARKAGRKVLAWVGARNIGDTHIRHTLSAYPNLPVLCKNDGEGNITPAQQAMKTIAAPHENVDVMLSDGRMGVVPRSSGNPNTALLWRGGSKYKTAATYLEGLRAAAEAGEYGIDFSHGGAAAFDWKNEKSVAGIRRCRDAVIDLMLRGSLARPPRLITFEANLLEGADTSRQTPGMSWTDACLSMDEARPTVLALARAHAKSR